MLRQARSARLRRRRGRRRHVALAGEHFDQNPAYNRYDNGGDEHPELFLEGMVLHCWRNLLMGLRGYLERWPREAFLKFRIPSWPQLVNRCGLSRRTLFRSSPRKRSLLVAQHRLGTVSAPMPLKTAMRMRGQK